MRILLAHNRYQQRGGEDTVAAAEAELLASHSHTVERLEVDNDHIQGAFAQIGAAAHSVYSLPGKARVKAAIARSRPDVVHVHNFFPTLSPSVFYACAEAGVPVVHTLHNFRIQCSGATLFRDGAVCEECVEKPAARPGLLPGAVHAGAELPRSPADLHLRQERLRTGLTDWSAYKPATNRSVRSTC